MQQALVCTSGLALPARQQARGRRAQSAVLSKPALAVRRGELLAAKALGGGPRKTLKREEEPDEYWSSKGEREGKNPMQDPIAWIGILTILGPLILLGLFAALGVVDLTPRV